MKKIFSLLAASTVLLFAACNNSTDTSKNTDTTTAKEPTQAATTSGPLTLSQVLSQSNVAPDRIKTVEAFDKLVLIDFYADWCGPCKHLSPNIDAIADELKGQLEVVRINVDSNKALSSALKIEGIPLIHIYKGGNKVWENMGYMDKDPLEAAIKKQL